MAISKAPVALEIRLDLEDRRNGGTVREEPAPTKTLPASEFVGKVFTGKKIEHLPRSAMVDVGNLDDDDGHGGISPTSLFFQSAHRAFAGHHALGLRPEVLMYLINSVVAETVRRHPEDFRHLFTTSAGKTEIRVKHHGLVLGEPNSPWFEAIHMFDDAIRPRIPSETMDSMLPKLSTATMESDIASLVSFMDAASPYYQFVVRTLCGIPRIVLFGEASDYRKIHAAAGALAGNFHAHLKAYFETLLPVLDTIATAAETGRIDPKFWANIYKHLNLSGGPEHTGWLSAFLWYVNRLDHKTGTFALEPKNLDKSPWYPSDYPCVKSGSEPAHVSRVPFAWEYGVQKFPMHFIGGVLAVEVDEGAITPKLSYGVLHT